MGFLFILLCVCSNVTKSYFSKTISGRLKTVSDSIDLNIIRFTLCCAIGFIIMLIKNKGLHSFEMPYIGLVFCAVTGFAQAAFSICWLLSLKSNSYMLVSAGGAASFIIPCLVGVFVIGEKFKLNLALSLILICIALFFMLRYNTKIKGKISTVQLLFISGALVFQGISQAAQKLFTTYVSGGNVGLFTFYGFIFTDIAVIVFRSFRKRSEEPIRGEFLKSSILPIIVMAAMQFTASYFQTLAAAKVQAIILFPMISALNLIAASILVSVTFKEKFKRDSILGIAFTLAAILLSKL